MPRATVGKLKSSGRRFDEPPNNPSYFTVVSEAANGPDHGRDALEPLNGVRTTIVHADSDAEAREIVDLIEKQHADHYGDKPWTVTSVTENVEHDVERP
jgi:hypothetical protein